VRDLFAHKYLGIYERSFLAKVNPSGVVMVKISPCDKKYRKHRTKKQTTAKGKARKYHETRKSYINTVNEILKRQ
jgi:hypothetical protein